jgi:hypothetical protein
MEKGKSGFGLPFFFLNGVWLLNRFRGKGTVCLLVTANDLSDSVCITRQYQNTSVKPPVSMIVFLRTKNASILQS